MDNHKRKNRMSKLNSSWEELESLGIKIQKINELFSINYCQINSPKFHPIADQCRGLITDKDLNIISRSFDRFYNYGEDGTNFYLEPNFQVIEKIDGTLIKLYWYNNQWNISTRSNPIGNNLVGDYKFTYAELVHCALAISLSNLSLNKNFTHIFELTSPYNKNVTNYGKDIKLYYLISRDNNNGEFLNYSQEIKKNLPHVLFPQIYNFSNLKDVLESSKTLPNLEEGFVIYNNKWQPILKIKNPKYVIAHRLRNNGLTYKKAIQLILDNEYQEYLSYFPDDIKIIEEIKEKINRFLDGLQNAINNLDYSLPQKEFALATNDYPKEYKGFLFLSKKYNNNNARKLFFSPIVPANKKIKLIIE